MVTILNGLQLPPTQYSEYAHRESPLADVALLIEQPHRANLVSYYDEYDLHGWRRKCHFPLLSRLPKRH